MSIKWGRKLSFTVFGESHGFAIGGVLEGFPSGLELDEKALNREMSRRAPGSHSLTTSRKEADQVRFLSGIYQGKTTGSPIAFMIENTQQRSRDYEDLRYKPRPSHADLVAEWKYNGFQDPRGGGHFSGRLTAPMVLAGALAKQWLALQSISIQSHVLQIGKVKDHSWVDEFLPVKESFIATTDEKISQAMEGQIAEAKLKGDSVGGIIECAVLGMKKGYGDPIFQTLEGELSKGLFSIPAVKGLSFGLGFDFAHSFGSQVNDCMRYQEGRLTHESNYNGGIIGGISTGMPIVFQVAMKPTPSIAVSQNTVDLSQQENIELQIKGRHDPCIVPRALPVVEAMAALTILGILL